MRVALYARVSTHDQKTLPLQNEQMKNYATARGWTIVKEVSEIGSGAKRRPEREKLLQMARRREIDIILVWKLDRFGRSLSDLITTLEELQILGVGFVSITEALDLTTPSGRALAGMLSVFAQFEREMIKERVKAGIAASKAKGNQHGRPPLSPFKKEEIRRLAAEIDATGERIYNNSAIAKKLEISRGSVIKELSKYADTEK